MGEDKIMNKIKDLLELSENYYSVYQSSWDKRKAILRGKVDWCIKNWRGTILVTTAYLKSLQQKDKDYIQKQ